MSEHGEKGFQGLRVGLDVGALYVKLVALDSSGETVVRESRPHLGEIFRVTRQMVDERLNGAAISAVNVVGVNAGPVARALGVEPGNTVAATIRAVHEAVGEVRQIVDIGGGSLSMVALAEDGSFVGYHTNTLCAAGTGSFLDEQASRLGIEYSKLDALPFIPSPPSVAARCAVFAKSDLIHRQQEGHSKPEMWSGLCRGLTHTIVMTLFKGRTPEGRTAVVGGVARNKEVMRWLAGELKVELVVPPSPQEAAAYGAARIARPLSQPVDWSALERVPQEAAREAHRPPLLLKRSAYPSFEVMESYIDAEKNEVRITRWPAGGLLRGYLGIDIGSTSTKLLLIGEDEQPILDIYRKTGGDPIGATKSIFRALSALIAKKSGRIEVLGSATTGSGRKLVGAVIGADRVINEITAHVAGAMKVDPTIDTIFEIGGQDAKYVHTVGGHLHNSNMNYVCAAGTGSFVEELARKMGFDIFALGGAVMGVEPPVTSDRCTVFMEQDVRALLRKGYQPKEAMGAVMYSVVQNYLNKVVGSRYYSKKKVFFQGATARNTGLVAAFENLLNIEVVVSPYCHVMGSWGVALLAKRQMEARGEKTKFVGLSFADKEVKLSQEACPLCANRCSISYADVEGLDGRPSWGYLCGRDPEDAQMRRIREFDLFRLRDRLFKQATSEPKLPEHAPKIGMPRALLAHNYYPFWRRLFAELGYNLELSKPTDRAVIEQSSDWVGADYCFPVKLAHGHARQLLEKDGVENIFVPYMVSAGDTDGKTSESYFCPYNIALPALIASAMTLNGIAEERLIKATMDFRWDDDTAIVRLTEDLGQRLGRSKREVAAAWKAAKTAQKAYDESLAQAGRDKLPDILAADRPAVVILGRPYNVNDPGANLALPEKIARLGLPVVPMDFLPLDEEDLGKEFHNMYWNFGRRMLEAARFVARTPNLYAVYFSNFSCGPDSFIQTYAEEIMGEKPMLMLELDEHGADAGYLTRLEAFADVLAANDVKAVKRYAFVKPPADKASMKGRTVWVPPMSEQSSAFLAAALRSVGYDAQPLPLEDRASFLKGRANTRGGECLPCPATMGTFIATVERQGGDPSKHALFMPTAEGPCRFGNYCTLDRIVFNRMGWSDVPVMSWNSTDSYEGSDETLRKRVWTGLVLGDVLFKMRCRITPYETVPGRTEAVYEKWVGKLADAIASNAKLDPVVAECRDDFMSIPRRPGKKPLVGIVGEIYVRQNRFTNQDVVRRIERAGGEAWMAPISEWVLYTAHMEAWTKGYRHGGMREKMAVYLKNRFLAADERHYMDLASPILDDRHEPPVSTAVEEGSRFVPLDFEGEVIITLGRTIEFMRNGADLVVNCAPFGCMPGAITAGVFQRIQAEYGVPVANLFYDGEGDVNRLIDTYLANILAAREAAGYVATGTGGRD
ncbi:MAG: hypothetical protein C4523_17675 [Myxococcales bacterium]|nr:MAG: hypothetical protein C4523_17675 [Myxococcales bacterium]